MCQPIRAPLEGPDRTSWHGENVCHAMVYYYSLFLSDSFFSSETL